MPPKAKFTKEQIVDAALEIVKYEGADALTARRLGEELGCSSRPVFTVFDSMEEVQREVITAATKIYQKFEDEGMCGDNAFKGSGIGYIRFAAEYPKLFQMLFMKELNGTLDTESVLENIDDYYYKILNSIETEYGFDAKTSKEIYLHLWIYSHGIASLIATNVCSFTPEQISQMLGTVGAGIIGKYRKDTKK